MPRLLWTLKQHVGPPPRAGHVSAFDTRRHRTILFGGDSLRGALFRDTWEWDGDSWSQLSDIGPPARLDAALVFDSARNRTVLFGGAGQQHGALGDTWEWDGSDWTQMADTGPPARFGHAMAFDSARGRAVLFGGGTGEDSFGDTWEWNGDEWVQVENVGPSPRRFHAMTFDSSRSRVVLFGGLDGTSTVGDTWEFDGNAWSQIVDFGPPPALAGTLLFSGSRSRLFGGAAALTDLAEILSLTWEWDGRHWTIRQDLGPGPRWRHTMVFDVARVRGVLFGGTASRPGADPQVALGETWEQFEDGARRPQDPSPPPPPPPPGQLSGVARDYFSMQPLDGVTLNVDGHSELSAVTGADGGFTISGVPVGEPLLVIASRPSHLETRTNFGSLPAGSGPASVVVFLVTRADLNIQAAGVGETQLVTNGALFIELLDDAGQPREGIPAADIQLERVGGTPGDALGPFFFGAGGVLDSTLTVATAFDGRARAAFLNVAPGPHRLQIATTSPPETLTTDLNISDGVMITRG